jgi:site-specific DNA-cytosine methylase
MRVLIACEYSGRVRQAFRERGHDAWSCDLLPADDDSAYHLQDDVTTHLDLGWDLMIAHPPCTHLSSSGAAHFAAKRADGRQQDAIDFFLMIADAPIPKIAIENPVGIMSTQYRKPDQLIQPFEYGHPETKKTCLWLKGLPKLVPTNIVEPEFMRRPDGSYYTDSKGKRYSRIHFMSGRGKAGTERGKARSLTYQGWADAMATQWSTK